MENKKSLWQRIKSLFSRKKKEVQEKMVLELQDPYCVQYNNTTNKEQRCVLFGFNDHNCKPNFGNPKGVEITNLQGGTYGRILSQSGTRPFMMHKLRVQSSLGFGMTKRKGNNTYYSTLMQTGTFVQADANGIEIRRPVRFEIDAYQQQANVIDVSLSKPIKSDGSMSMEFNLPPKEIIVFTIYPGLMVPESQATERQMKTYYNPFIIDSTVQAAPYWKFRRFISKWLTVPAMKIMDFFKNFWYKKTNIHPEQATKIK